MKCSYAAFGEQNKTDNDSKCQQIYKSQFFYISYLFVLFSEVVEEGVGSSKTAELVAEDTLLGLSNELLHLLGFEIGRAHV